MGTGVLDELSVLEFLDECVLFFFHPSDFGLIELKNSSDFDAETFLVFE
jgi:hypothetical protein